VPARVLALRLLLVLAAAPAHAADDVENFYRGKQIRFIVGSAPGGTYDLLARIVARHIGAHIPGSPTIIVQNQPTAGGLLMVNQLYALGPNDGTAIGVPLNGIPAAPLLQPAAARFDAAKLIWLGSTHSEPYVAYVWHTAPVQNLAEVMSKPLVVGATTPGTTMNDFPQLTNAVLGTKFKIVPGYASTPQMNEALERGEVEGVAGFGWFALNAQVPQWVTEKKITVIAQFGATRHRLLPDVPLMLDLAKSDADGRGFYGRRRQDRLRGRSAQRRAGPGRGRGARPYDTRGGGAGARGAQPAMMFPLPLVGRVGWGSGR
jgi:tripartite-type tricarboxylate transporter receptor subunit TctC